ncbi:MAG: efflux RND transporter permease subunit [Candidatus Methylomirabilia bacterium]
MFLSDLSIRRPVFAAVIMLTLVTLGVFSYRRLGLDFFPNVEIPVILITTSYPGASPETVEREVSKRIEEAVNPIAGVKHVTSTSLEGVSFVIAQFQLEVRVNEAVQEARAKINAVRGDLPAAIQEPVIQKFDVAAMPIISLAVRATGLSPLELSTWVDKQLKPRLESISGVGKIDLVGMSRREVSVELDPARLEALGLGVDEVSAGLRSENVNTPLGRLRRGATEVPMRVSGKPDFVEGYADMVVASRADRPVTLGDVARVSDGIEERRTLAFIDGAAAVGVDVLKQSGANTVAVIDAVKSALERVNRTLPPGVSVTIVRDTSKFIRESVDDVVNSLVLGGVLTIFIVFLFLNSWRSTVITGLTLPISVISSFIVMNFMGMTLNVLTLMALSLSIGMLIDDAIVVRENIVRHLEMGKDHFAAAREGTAEIGLAVLATSLSVVAVFVPVAFMKGIVGRFFFSFGITVAWAVLVSLLVSFTLDPMLSSRWNDPSIGRRGRRNLLGRFLDGFNDWFNRGAERYRGVIAWALDHRKSVLALATLAFAAGMFIFGQLESAFIPEQDRGEFQVQFQSAPDASIEETRARLEEIFAILKAVPEVEHTYGTIGASDTTVRDALVYVRLKERNLRTRSQKEVQRDVRERLGAVAGVRAAIIKAGDLFNGKELMVNVQGDDLAVLKRTSGELMAKVRKIPGVVDVGMTLQDDIPEYRFTVDRRKAADLGLTTAALVRTVGTLVGGTPVTTWENEDGDAVQVRLRLPAALRENPEQIGRLRLAVPGADGRAQLIPLGEVLTWQVQTTPSQIARQDLSRQVVIAANLDGIPIGTAVEKVKQAAATMTLPPGYKVSFSGEAEDMAESFGYMGEALLLAVLLVYLILAAQFESFLDPLAIMISLPLSIVGVAGMLLLTRDTISIMSFIGLIMLMGLVTKNAILLVAYAKTLRAGGLGRREALITAGRTRLRPIMMTTLAMIFGMLPTALGLGAGAEMRAPMARAVTGGLITSTVLTLLVVPVVYTLFDDFEAWILRLWSGSGGAQS